MEGLKGAIRTASILWTMIAVSFMAGFLIHQYTAAIYYERGLKEGYKVAIMRCLKPAEGPKWETAEYL